jgi:DNA polymerase-4
VLGDRRRGHVEARRHVARAQLAAREELELTTALGGATGRHLHALANVRDPRRVERRKRRRSIGAQHALGRRSRTPEAVDAALVALVDRVTGRLRKAERVARTVVLRLRFDDFKRATRSRTLGEPTDRTETVLAAARVLLEAAQPLIEQRGITLVGVAMTNVEDRGAAQLPLDDRTALLDSTLDELRERYGTEVITRAVLIDRDETPRLPMLPD